MAMTILVQILLETVKKGKKGVEKGNEGDVVVRVVAVV